jgi:hypothetical protein
MAITPHTFSEARLLAGPPVSAVVCDAFASGEVQGTETALSALQLASHPDEQEDFRL